jgi:ATP-dependent exoDNAse (exonuclease V) beta subunit
MRMSFRTSRWMESLKTLKHQRRLKPLASQCVDQIKMREEMRLAYVAVTRARTHLICTTCMVARRGKLCFTVTDL